MQPDEKGFEGMVFGACLFGMIVLLIGRWIFS